MMYMVSVSPDVLTVADIEVNYVDASGAKQKEIMTDTVWKKPFTANTLPLTEGIWAKLTPKTILAEGTYQLGIQTAASYRATLPDGSQIDEAYGNDYESTVATAQSADEVAAWCAKSPTVAITINEDGNAQLTTVDFGGNAGSDGGGGSSALRIILLDLGFRPCSVLRQIMTNIKKEKVYSNCQNVSS